MGVGEVIIMSAVIPPEVQEFLKYRVGWVATSAKDGTSNVSRKDSPRMLDEEHLVFAAMAWDAEAWKACTLKGSAQMLTEGPLLGQSRGPGGGGQFA